MRRVAEIAADLLMQMKRAVPQARHIGCVWSMIRDHMDYVMPIDEDDDGDESWLDEPTKPIGPNGW